MRPTRLLLVMLLASCVWAQTPGTPPQAAKQAAGQNAGTPTPAAQKAAPAPRPTPPELKAYQDANAIKDPLKRIEALEKWIADNPKHNMVVSARRGIITAAVKAYPKDPKKIESMSLAQIKTVTPVQAPQLYGGAATAMAADGVALDVARKFAKQQIKLLNYDSYAADARASLAAAAAAARPAAGTAAAPAAARAAGAPAAGAPAAAAPARPAIPEDRLKKNFASMTASAWATLGQVEFKATKYSAAEKAYLKAISIDPAQKTSAALTLAQVYEKRNKPAQAMQYATTARLGRPNKESREVFAKLYQKTHKGKSDGIEEFLDAEYHKQYPSPIKLDPYKKTEKRTDRVVLAEVHTGAGCPPCVAADLAFDALMQRYSRNDLVVLMYHQHIPRPDPMTNPETLDRWKFIKGQGVPTYVVDGTLQSGGGAREGTGDTAGRIEKLITPRLEAPAEAKLAVKASSNGKLVKVETNVTGLKNAEDLVLRVALTEKEIRYSGENGVRFHPMVVRSLASLPVKAEGKLEQVFDLDKIAGMIEKHIADFEKHDDRHNTDGAFRFMEYPIHVNPKELAVVVYLENEKSKAILQAAQAEVSQ